MSFAFWVFVIILISIAAILAWRLLNRKQLNLASLTTGDAVNLTLNLAMLTLTVISIFIAIAAFQDSKNSGDEQKKALNASRESLLVVISALKKQTALLDSAQDTLRSQLAVSRQQQKAMAATNSVLQSSKRTLKSQLDISAEQNKRELERLKRKPNLHFTLGEVSEERFSAGAALPIKDAGNLILIVTNTGDAALNSPTLIINTPSEQVQVFTPGLRGVDDEDHSRLQLSGSNMVQSMEPKSQIGSGYSFRFRLIIPANVSIVTLMFKIYGNNMPVHGASISLKVIRP